jgi:hypothetical protein
MAAQIRELDSASERVAVAIAGAVAGARTGESSRRDELISALAAAIVERTAEVRTDCSRLAGLVERIATLGAEQEALATCSEYLSQCDPTAESERPAVKASDRPRWPTDADELITLAREHLAAAGVVQP